MGGGVERPKKTRYPLRKKSNNQIKQSPYYKEIESAFQFGKIVQSCSNDSTSFFKEMLSYCWFFSAPGKTQILTKGFALALISHVSFRSQPFRQVVLV
jgi:hypothetical protein